MNFIKVSFIVSIGFLCRLVLGILTNKLVAVYAGTTGIAFMGQFQSFLQMVMSLSSGTIEAGIIKHTAEYSSNQNKLNLYWSTAIKISFSVTFILSCSMLFFRNYLSIFLFDTEEYASVFLFFAINIFLFTLNNFLLSILNGLQKISLLVMLQMVGYLMSFITIGILVYIFKIYGVLIGLTISQSLALLVTLFCLKKQIWFKVANFIQKFDESHSNKVFNFAFMAFSSAISVPTVQILIRNYIGHTLSWEDVGMWQGMWKISDIYLAIFISVISMYFLPKLSETHDVMLLKKELWFGLRIIVPLTIIVSFSIFLLKDTIIIIIFTKDFLPMQPLFKFQLIGDVFRITGVLFGYLLLAKTMTKVYIFAEISFNILFLILSIIFINYFALIGVTYAYMFNSLLYMIFLIWIFRRVLFAKK